MATEHGHRLGHGPLTLAGVLRIARGMFSAGRRRVIAVALVLFGFPALLAAAAQNVLGDHPGDIGILPIAFSVVALLVAGALRLFGPVLYSGYLDEAVGREYLFGHHSSFGEVLRSLPWGRLLIADFIVTSVTAIGLLLFFVPGVVVYALFGLVGPVIVQERRGLRDGFGRTYRISRSALWAIVVLVLIPTAGEQVIHAFALEATHDAWIGFHILAEWAVAALIGGAVGLLEVALAAELMARNPEPATLPFK